MRPRTVFFGDYAAAFVAAGMIAILAGFASLGIRRPPAPDLPGRPSLAGDPACSAQERRVSPPSPRRA